ncbi:MAG: hypothetical protein ACE14P_12635 [Methanotrichaceae archaeon]
MVPPVTLDERSPAMAAGLTDHIWTINGILMNVVVPDQSNMK